MSAPAFFSLLKTYVQWKEKKKLRQKIIIVVENLFLFSIKDCAVKSTQIKNIYKKRIQTGKVYTLN